MNAIVPDPAITPFDEPQITVVDGWSIRAHTSVSSTNLVAANLPAWTAVRAAVQTAGRGRFQRSWVSDEGGLWLSAVVPALPQSLGARTLPLAVGLAVCDALCGIGVHGLRLRWPNDALVNDRKLAGLLIDQFTPALAVAGIGVNVCNRPEIRDIALQNRTARLADLLACPPTLEQLTVILLQHLRRVVDEWLAGGFSNLLLRVNTLWGPPRPVELDLDGTLRRGTFTGVDEEGRLQLAVERADITAYDASQVRRLTEL